MSQGIASYQSLWSRDLSAAMKGTIGEDDFLAYREQVLARLGEFQSIESVTLVPGSSKGYVRWVAVTKFEYGRMQFGFGFKEDGREITGVFPEVVSQWVKGTGLAFVVDALTFLVSLAALWLMRPLAVVNTAGLESVLSSIRSGLSHVWSDVTLRTFFFYRGRLYLPD